MKNPQNLVANLIVKIINLDLKNLENIPSESYNLIESKPNIFIAVQRELRELRKLLISILKLNSL